MDRRLEVIKATIILSAERGVHDTPMSEIYKKAGVSAGTIYHHFRSKDEFERAMNKFDKINRDGYGRR